MNMNKDYIKPSCKSICFETEGALASSAYILYITSIDEPSVQDADDLLAPGSTSITW